MEDFISFFLILVCITIFYIYLESKSLDVTYVKTSDTDSFLVRNLPDKETAAKLLTDIRDNLQKIVDHVKTQTDCEEEDKKRLVKNFRGNIIISVGNYENISFKYLKELHKNFTKIKNYDFIMPWNHEERLKIFVRR